MNFFKLQDNRTTVKQEVIAGATTFITMAYGMTAGFVVYPVIKTLAGRAKDVTPGLWFLCFLSLLFFIFYPY